MWNDPALYMGMLAGFTAGTLYGLLHALISFSLLNRVTRQPRQPTIPPMPEKKPLPTGEYFRQLRDTTNLRFKEHSPLTGRPVSGEYWDDTPTMPQLLVDTDQLRYRN